MQDLSQMTTEELLRLRGRAAPAPSAAPSVTLPQSRTSAIQNQGRLVDTEGQVVKNKVDAATAPAVISKADADAQKAAADAAIAAQQANQFGLTPEQFLTRRDSFDKLPFFEQRLGELKTRYERDFKGISPLEYGGIRSANKEFDDASGSLRAYIAGVLGLSGQQFNTPAEQQAFIGTLLPAAGDRDGQIESKIGRLQDLLDNAKKAGAKYGFALPEEEAELVEFTPNPDLRLNDKGQVVNIKTGEIVLLPSADTGPSGWDNFLSGVGDIVKGVGDTVGLVTNPLNTAVNSVFGTNIGTDLGTAAREATGLPNISTPMARAINEGGASGLGFTGLARGGVKIATGLTEEALKRLSATPLTDMFTGAVGNSAAEVVRQEGGGALAQTTAALLAGAPAYGIGRATDSIVNPGPKTAAAQAAERQGILMMPADAGGPITRRVSGGAAQLPISAGPILEGAEASIKSAEKAVNRNVNNLGGVLSEVEAGKLVSTTAENVSAAKTVKSDQLITDLNAKAQGVNIAPTEATKLIDAEIDRLNRNPGTNAEAIAELETLRGDITGGQVLQGIRDLKTTLNASSYNGKIRSTPDKARNKRIAEALDADIETSLAAAPDALDAYKSFNSYYTERAGVLDQFDSLLGTGKSGEVLLKDIESLGRGNKGGVETLRTVFSEMKPADADQLRATVVDRLGRQQNNSDFSADVFFSNYGEKMTDDAKDAMFGAGGLRRNLDEIATVAKEMKAAGRFANTSNSGGAVNIGLLSTPSAAAMFTDAVTATQALVGTLVMGGTQYAAGKLLASPKFASWLARAPKSNDPLAIRNYATKLTAIAAAQPELAPDIEAYQQSVLDATGKVKPKGALAE
jgi:hypothetical protein